MTINENDCEDHRICKNHKLEQVTKSIKVHFPHEEKAKSFSFRLTVPENYGPKSNLKPSTASKGIGPDRIVCNIVAKIQEAIEEGRVPQDCNFE